MSKYISVPKMSFLLTERVDWMTLIWPWIVPMDDSNVFLYLDQVYFDKKTKSQVKFNSWFFMTLNRRMGQLKFNFRFSKSFLYFMVHDRWPSIINWVQNRQKKTNALNSQVLKPIICPIFFGWWTFLEQTWSLTWHPVPMSLILAPFHKIHL